MPTKPIPCLTLALLTLATLLWLSAGPAPDTLVYDRAALAQGEIWRALTGHLVHSDAEHALWDIAALALVGAMLERQSRCRLIGATLAGVLAVNACLWWCLPELARYCGLSGVLNSLFVVALAGLWRRQRHPLIPLVAVGLALKLAIELATRQSLVLDMAWASLPEAHVAGCLGGLAYLWLADHGFCGRGLARADFKCTPLPQGARGENQPAPTISRHPDRKISTGQKKLPAKSPTPPPK